MIPARDRLAWHRQMSSDPELSQTAFKVAVIISNHVNNQTGETFIGLERLAREARRCRRSVWAAIEQLAKRGHLQVKKGGGRAKANSYAMILLNGATHCTVSDPETVQFSARSPP
jgi:hypothetical protein